MKSTIPVPESIRVKISKSCSVKLGRIFNLSNFATVYKYTTFTNSTRITSLHRIIYSNLSQAEQKSTCPPNPTVTTTTRTPVSSLATHNTSKVLLRSVYPPFPFHCTFHSRFPDSTSYDLTFVAQLLTTAGNDRLCHRQPSMGDVRRAG